MSSIHRGAVLALALALGAAGLTACGSSGSSANGAGNYVDGKTFSYAVTDDPGSLDPQVNLTAILVQLNRFAYDSLVSVKDDGSIAPQLASSWKTDGTTLTLQIRDGVTCADGTAFTAQTAADNINWVADPKHQSQYLGVYLPPGASASAAGSTLTIKLAQPVPFVLNGLANLSMVCPNGLKDRSILKSRTDGTGPFVLSRAAVGSEYVYTVRKGYAWGPDGAKTSAHGTPAKIDVKVIANDTTAANQLLAGQLNGATIKGATDADRLAGAGLDFHKQLSIVGEQSYNHAAGHPTSSADVRMALTQALDLADLQKVLTSGQGEPATELAVTPPAACPGNSVKGAVPEQDVDAANAALDRAGWVKGADGVRTKDGQKLTLRFDYVTLLGPGASAAAELAASAWKAIGAEVKMKGITITDFTSVAINGGWDVLWVPFNGSSPDQLVSILSGTPAPKGNNFAAIDNADYQSHVAKALAAGGTKGCPDWLAAESALFKAADLVPFANLVVKTFAKNATFDMAGNIVPTSIRMLG
jgi:peptide/nickel transport system substrate-binding protein